MFDLARLWAPAHIHTQFLPLCLRLCIQSGSEEVVLVLSAPESQEQTSLLTKRETDPFLALNTLFFKHVYSVMLDQTIHTVGNETQESVQM